MESDRPGLLRDKTSSKLEAKGFLETQQAGVATEHDVQRTG